MSNDKKYRYPGTRPFETTERELFFGRSTDSKELYQQVLNEKSVLLYAKSGLGKSSLINAGLIPLFEQSQEFKLFLVRFGNYNSQLENYEKPLDKLIAQINSQINPDTSYLDRIVPNENSLWYRFKQRQNIEHQTFLLFIFDQFEELMTYPEEDIFHFKKQFAHLLFTNIPPTVRNVFDRKLEKDINLLNKTELLHLNTSLKTKALFAIRSDRMSDLNRIADYFPNILKTFYELKPLGRKQAVEAITGPAQSEGDYLSTVFSFETSLTERIIKNLEDYNTHTVESFQLQMVCRYAEELIIQKKTVTEALVTSRDLGDISSIFAKNYYRILNELPLEFRSKVQVLVEERLIVSGNRVPLPEIIIQQELIPQHILNKLLDSHLLRAERNSTGGRSIELSHDTLIAPVTDALKKRKERLEKQRLEAEVIKKQQELEAALILEKEKSNELAKQKQLELDAARHESAIREAELARQRAEEEAFLRKRAELSNRRARRNLRFALIITFIVIILAVFSFLSYQRANKATKIANEQKATADKALSDVRRFQALSKATELKSYGDSYKNLGQTKLARENYKIALDTLSRYTDLKLYKDLLKQLNDLK